MRIVVSASNVVNYPQGGGHFWVYLQYIDGLRRLGSDVWWLEQFKPTGDSRADAQRVATLVDRLRPYGIDDRVILYTGEDQFVNVSAAQAHRVFATADLLLNFHQLIEGWLLERFRLTALVDIDPGLLQQWIGNGELTINAHDLYFTTGETVGKPTAKFPDCGLDWIPIRPAVSLDLWPRVAAPKHAAFTTVSGWWAGEWVSDGDEWYDNNKRCSFLRFAELPRYTQVPLELAINMDPESTHDRADRELLTANGWRVRQSYEVAGSPEDYRRYIQSSRGEFSCAKRSCMKFQNAWISDRTLCYLATGRPAVVQDTGPSALLPRDRGLFRFSTLEEAVAALQEADANYDLHAKAAREIAEIFDARRIAEMILRYSGSGTSAAVG